MRRRLPRVRLVALLLIAFAALALVRADDARAFSIEFQGRVVKRTVLALFDSKAEGAADKTRLHKLAEMPLNHLGYMLDYRDIHDPLPTDLARYRGVVTWFVEPFQDTARYVNWLDAATQAGLKLVALGELVPKESNEDAVVLNRVLARIGLQSANNFVVLTQKSRVVTADPQLIGFEQSVDKALPGFPIITVRSASTKSHLVIEAPLANGVVQSSVVSTSAGGGYAAQNFTYSLDPNTNRMEWILNPFQFFKLALGDERFPIPDVTTVSGRRIYFSHIDGDGWNNISEVEGYRQAQALSVEVIAREAIQAYPDLPVSVGLIAADVQPLLGGLPGGIKIARQMYAMPNVEVASHTHTHPYHWSFFEDYDRAKEEALVKGYRPPAMPFRERFAAALLRAAGKTYSNARYDPYIAGSDDLPRTYLRTPFNLELEVGGALKFTEQFAPPGKKAKLYLWSGNTSPFEAAIAATRRAGVRNLNGGDSRLDKEFPSVGYVPPISRPVGAERQIYAVNSNENTYTNDWTGPFGGQMMLMHTLQNTEAPRRLKAFNLYYHMYSGEKPAALKAVKHFLDEARSARVAPIAASEYAGIADDYFTTEIEQVDLFSWAVKNRGTLNTLRFDDAEHLSVDLAASNGVLGFTRYERAIYVSLDQAAERPVITLKAAPADGKDAVEGRQLSLVDARWRFSDMRISDCDQSMTAQGFGAGDMTWRGRPNAAYRVRATRNGAPLTEEIRWTDAGGLLQLKLAIDGIEPVSLRFTCHE